MRGHEAGEALGERTRRRTWVPGPDLIIVLVGIAGLILLATVIEEVERFEEREELTAFDAAAAQWIAVNVPPRVFQLGVVLARIGSGVFVASFALVAGAFAWSRRRRAEAILIPVGALLLHLLVEALKAHFGRARPAVGLSEAAGLSFPSGHAAFGAYLGMVILWLALHHVRRRGWMMGALWFAVAWALLQALGRMAIGVHYLSDVLAGLGLGATVAAVALVAAPVALRALRPWMRSRRRFPRLQH